MSRTVRFAALMLLALAAGAAAPPPDPAALDPSMAQPVPTKLKGYLGPGVLDGRLILGPPPAPDSPQGRADRAIYEEKRALDVSEHELLNDVPELKLADNGLPAPPVVIPPVGE